MNTEAKLKTKATERPSSTASDAKPQTGPPSTGDEVKSTGHVKISLKPKVAASKPTKPTKPTKPSTAQSAQHTVRCPHCPKAFSSFSQETATTSLRKHIGHMHPEYSANRKLRDRVSATAGSRTPPAPTAQVVTANYCPNCGFNHGLFALALNVAQKMTSST